MQWLRDNDAEPDRALIIPDLVQKALDYKTVYDIGEECWIFIGMTDKNGHAVTSPGTVIHVMQLPQYMLPQYVIAMHEVGRMYPEIRDCYLMAPDSETSPAVVQNFKDRHQAQSDRSIN